MNDGIGGELLGARRFMKMTSIWVWRTGDDAVASHHQAAVRLSGNQCAFPGCTDSLVDPGTGTILGEICHIKARSDGGPRFDDALPPAKRDEFENLLLMNPDHHTIIDANTGIYTVEHLQKIKADHENRGKAVAEPSDMVVDVLINKLEIREGSLIINKEQQGGQVAHQINNVYVTVLSPPFPASGAPPPPLAAPQVPPTPIFKFEFDPAGNPDQFAPALGFRSQTRPYDLLWERRYLKVKVCNTGKAQATNCKATVQLLQPLDGCSGPSREQKVLRWGNGNERLSISPGDGEMLDVVFSNSLALPMSKGIKCGFPREAPTPQPDSSTAWREASLGTPRSDAPRPQGEREEDTLCEGRFDLLIRVTCAEGAVLEQRYRVTVRRDWREISMEPIV